MANTDNLPANCLGNEISTRCIADESGKPLTSILAEIKASVAKTIVPASTIYSDDIVSTSVVRSRSYICSSQIIKRDFTYGITLTQSNAVFNWDLLGVTSALPSGYKLATSSVKITGVNLSGSNDLGNSKSLSAGIGLNASNFPINVNIVLRVTSPCGDIELTSRLLLTNPAVVGEFRTNLAAEDLNPKSSQINLTDQLNNIESQLSALALTVETYKSVIDSQRLEIETLKDKVEALEAA